jgi:hypothetical protein
VAASTIPGAFIAVPSPGGKTLLQAAKSLRHIPSVFA